MSSAFKVVVADPAWKFGDRLPENNGAEAQYRCIPTWQIQRLELPPIADDAYLFMWRVAAMPQDALDVIKAWGFVAKTELVWRKQSKLGKRHMGMGHHLRAEHEVCILATRGRPKPKSKSIRTVFDAPVGRHSEKPEMFFDIVEQFADGPYVELFARRHRKGWKCFGDELNEVSK